MTVIYLQCQNPECQGLGTRSRKRERCRCCGQMAEKKDEVFTCKLCGEPMKPMKDHMIWEQRWHELGEDGKPKYPRDA